LNYTSQDCPGECRCFEKTLENHEGYLRLTTWMAGTSPAMTASIDSIEHEKALAKMNKISPSQERI
jgi:hypothetical protein